MARLSKGSRGFLGLTIVLALASLAVFFYAPGEEAPQPVGTAVIAPIEDLGETASALKDGADQVALVVRWDGAQWLVAGRPLAPLESLAAPLLLWLEGEAAGAKALLSLLPPTVRGQVLVTSADWRLLLALKAADNNLSIAFFTSEQPGRDNVARAAAEPSPLLAGFNPHDEEGSLPRLVYKAGGKVWLLDYRDLREVDVADARRLGLRVMAWGVEDPAVLPSLAAWQLDAIVTSQVSGLRAALTAAGQPLPDAAPKP